MLVYVRQKPRFLLPESTCCKLVPGASKDINESEHERTVISTAMKRNHSLEDVVSAGVMFEAGMGIANKSSTTANRSAVLLPVTASGGARSDGSRMPTI